MTHYDLLSIARDADADTIKKAFRREIARYHPDKVIHLGAEFQEMAATRAAALTVAYKTLGDPMLREQYDATIAAGLPPVANHGQQKPAAAPVVADPAAQPHVVHGPGTPPPPSANRRFETERAGRDQILVRAIAARVRSCVESLFGAVEMPAVLGFDAVFVPVSKPRFLGSHPPRVLVKVSEEVNAAAVDEAWKAAVRSRIQAGKSPVVVLLCGRRLSSARELRTALDDASRQPRPAGVPDELVVAVINIGDWSCQMQHDVSPSVRKLIAAITG